MPLNSTPSKGKSKRSLPCSWVVQCLCAFAWVTTDLGARSVYMHTVHTRVVATSTPYWTHSHTHWWLSECAVLLASFAGIIGKAPALSVCVRAAASPTRMHVCTEARVHAHARAEPIRTLRSPDLMCAWFTPHTLHNYDTLPACF